MVISKMNMIGDRYKDNANDRAVRAEGLYDFMNKLREEEREQHKEQVKKEREQHKEQIKEEREQHKEQIKEEREQHEKEREQYKEQVAMLTKKLELLPFKDRKRLDKLYRKKKAEERKLKELEELEECDSEEE
jgi:DNA repair exonuclease SbcCD ATPase subunit